MAVKPYTININQTVLDDLKGRLDRTRWPDEPPKAGWNMGTNISYLKELVDYWRHTYDWRKQEAELNKLPQFMASIDGQDIHFVHIPSKRADAEPLLLLHGWPDSFYRFHKVIPLLTDDYHLIIPSLPGYGFSTHNTVGSSPAADQLAKLMVEELGYKQFLVAAGDRGSLVARALAANRPEAVKAMHLTDADYPTGQEDPKTMTKSEQEFAKFVQGWWTTQGAYAAVQSTKPQSIATALNDSPAGLAAWIVSFIDIAADNHDVEAAVGGRDELLTLIMIYWVSETPGPAAQAYFLDAMEKYSSGAKPVPKAKAPTGFTLFPREAPTPEDWVRRMTNLVSYQKANKGGHFAALEVPDIYADSLKAFFGSI